MFYKGTIDYVESENKHKLKYVWNCDYNTYSDLKTSDTCIEREGENTRSFFKEIDLPHKFDIESKFYKDDKIYIMKKQRFIAGVITNSNNKVKNGRHLLFGIVDNKNLDIKGIV